MRKILYINVIWIACLLSFSTIDAQTYQAGNDTQIQNFTKENAARSFLSNQRNSANLQSSSSINSDVFIAQIGNSNRVNVATTAQNNAITIQQNGDRNNAFLQVDAESVIETVRQNGVNHSFLDFGSTARIHNLEVNQSGANQNLVFHGGNSISERMKINMSGENQSIIVRNFN